MGFLNILQCILCSEEEDKLEIERNRYGYFEIAGRDSDFVSYICSKLQWIRFRPTNTTTTNAARFHYENNHRSSNASSIQSQETIFQSSIRVKSPGIVDYNYRSIESGKNNTDHSNVIKRDHNPERKVNKPYEFCRDQNLKDSSLSSSSSFVKTVQTLPFDPLKPIEGVQKGKGLAQKVNSASSHESQCSFKFPITLHSSSSTLSSSSLLENLKGSAPVTSSSSSSSMKPVSPRPWEPQKSIDGCQKGKGLPENVSSATFRESQSSFKSPVALHLANSSSASSLLERSPSPKPRPLSTKPTLLPTSALTYQQGTTNYILVEGSSTYAFSEDIKSLIEKEIVPGVLKKPLSMSTYKNYFHALLYAEDCYLEVIIHLSYSFNCHVMLLFIIVIM